jgi:hypothetical protein
MKEAVTPSALCSKLARWWLRSSRSPTFQHGIQKQEMQLPSMDRVLRPLEAGVQSSRVGIDLMTVAGHVFDLSCADARRGQALAEPELDERLGALRQ